jgi:hypothetical protein
LWHIIDIFHFASKNKIRQILQTEKPDLVHTHNLMGLGFLIPRLIKKMGLRYIHTVHDVQLVEPSGIILKQKRKKLALQWTSNKVVYLDYEKFVCFAIGYYFSITIFVAIL